jgi:MFS family permease
LGDTISSDHRQESVFAAFQLISIYHWAKASDAIGRRPVLLLGATGMGLMTFLFGFSRNLTSILITRSLHGFFAGQCSGAFWLIDLAKNHASQLGNIAVVQSVLGELSDPTNQAVMLPIYGLSWPLGTIIGPMVGGTFSNPADKFPLFDVPLLRQYPYAMPCLITSVFSVFGIALAYFFMEEVRSFSPPTSYHLFRSSTHQIDSSIRGEKAPKAI